MSFTYTRDIPDGPHNPSNDQPDMQTNTNSIDNLIAIDHVSFNSAISGYHTTIHQVDRTSNPAPISGVHQLFSRIPANGIPNNINDQLFAMNDGGGISQMTGSKSLQNGFVWCAGLLLQWGFRATTTSGSKVVLFNTSNVNFPTNLFNVQLSFSSVNNATLPVVLMSKVILASTAGFTAVISVDNTVGINGFYWFAIGN